ncbi:MAG: hypothetical protein ACJ8AW_36385 [Rhodopila sp.]
MRKRGLAGVLIATETFRPLVLAQAKARKLDPHLVVVRHPVGGLNASELEERITAAFEGLKLEMKG